MRTLTVVLSLIFLFSPAHAEPTPDQQARFNALSPEDAAKALRAYEDRQLLEHWKTVTRFNVLEMVRTDDMHDMDYGRVIAWATPASRNEQVKVWFSVEMPKDTPTPFDLQIQWSLDGKARRLKTFTVDRPSYRYRLWDTEKMTVPGVWTIQIVLDGRVLKSESYRVD